MDDATKITTKISNQEIADKISAIYDAVDLDENNTPAQRAETYIAMAIFVRVQIYGAGLLNLASMEHIIQSIMFDMHGEGAKVVHQNWVTETKRLLESGALGEGVN